MTDTVGIMMASANLEKALLGNHGKSEWFDKIPFLTLPDGYSFQVMFPFCGAVARFRVCKTGHPEKSVSVYLDTKDVLGYVGQPYWEAYPIGEGAGRFLLAEGNELIEAIVTELNQTAAGSEKP